jgi:membrane-associated protease RseP (regulator of RpoE activity)
MFGWLVLLVGIVYGYLKPGRQDKKQMLKTGAIVGLVLSVLLALLGMAVDFNPLGLPVGTNTFLGTVVAFIVMTVIFVIGVWVGDWLEGLRAPGTRRTV